MSAAEKILHDALELPRDERSKVAAELIASLDEKPQEGVDAAWAEEIQRRVARVRSGDSEGVAAEDVHARIRAALRR